MFGNRVSWTKALIRAAPRRTSVVVAARSRIATIPRGPPGEPGDDRGEGQGQGEGEGQGDRARLERAFAASAPRTNADSIRMAMFRRTNRVYDVDLHRSPDGTQLAIVITADTTAPERDTAAFMRKLAAIADIVSDLGFAQQLLLDIDRLPRDGLERAITIRLS